MRTTAIGSISDVSKWSLIVLAELAVGIIVLSPGYFVYLVIGLPIAAALLFRYRYAYFLGIVLLPVWALTVTGQTETPGQIDLRVSDVLFMVAGLGWLIDGLRRRKLNIQGGGLEKPLFIFFVWVVFSLMWTPELSLGVKEVIRKLNGLFIFYLTINVVKRQKDLDALMTIWIIAGVVAAAMVGFQVVTEIWNRLANFSEMVGIRWGGFRAGGLQVTANSMGFFLNMALMITISRFLTVRKGRSQVLLLFAMGFMMLALVATLSRNSILGFVWGCLVLLLILGRDAGPLAVVALGGSVVIAVIGAIAGPAYIGVLLERYYGIIDPETAAGFGRRVYMWTQVAWPIFKDHFLLGTGVGGFVVLAPLYGAWQENAPHNLYVYVTSEFGLIGLVLFSVVVFTWMGIATKAWRHVSGKRERCLLGGLIACIFVYGFQGLVINFILRETELWALLGLGLAAMRIYGPLRAGRRAPVVADLPARSVVYGGNAECKS